MFKPTAEDMLRSSGLLSRSGGLTRRYASRDGSTRRLVFLALLVPTIAFAQSALDRAKAEDPYLIEQNDPSMAAAIRTAQQTLGEFLAKWRTPPLGAEAFAVKVAVVDGNNVEYFWIIPFEANGTEFAGEINNQPQSVSNVTLGQRIEFGKSEIVDWLYMQSGKMIGNYTTCAILSNEPAESQAEFKAAVGLECEP